jgi:hypothetical protein
MPTVKTYISGEKVDSTADSAALHGRAVLEKRVLGHLLDPVLAGDAADNAFTNLLKRVSKHHSSTVRGILDDQGGWVAVELGQSLRSCGQCQNLMIALTSDLRVGFLANEAGDVAIRAMEKGGEFEISHASRSESQYQEANRIADIALQIFEQRLPQKMAEIEKRVLARLVEKVKS